MEGRRIYITIIDIYGQMDNKITISKKLGLVLSNVYDRDWKLGLAEEITDEINDRAKVAKKYKSEKFNIKEYDLKDLFSNNYIKDIFLGTGEENRVLRLVNCLTSLCVDDFENTMLVNRNEYMDSPTCEICFEKKFMNFYRFIIHNTHRNKKFTASSIITYCSNEIDAKSIIVSAFASRVDGNWRTGTNRFENYEVERELQIKSLVEFGRLIDGFIERKNDFFLLEYIMNALDESERYNAYYIFKIVSIIELLIKNPKHSYWHEDDFSKLAGFIIEVEDKKELARLIIQIRNKIGHGDFEALQNKAEEYAKKYMNDYYFDYYEYSRINWVFLNLSCRLNEMLSDIIWEYLNNKSMIQNQKLK